MLCNIQFCDTFVFTFFLQRIFCESLGGGTVKIRTSTDQSDVETLLNQKYNPNVNIGYWLGTKYFSNSYKNNSI